MIDGNDRKIVLGLLDQIFDSEDKGSSVDGANRRKTGNIVIIVSVSINPVERYISIDGFIILGPV